MLQKTTLAALALMLMISTALAFDAAKYGSFSPHPYLEATIPSLTDPSLAPEGKQLMPKFPKVQAWDARMDALPSVVRFNASLPPRAPIEHAREWAVSHRPAISEAARVDAA